VSHYRARWRDADYAASPDPAAVELWIRLRRDEPAEGFEEVEPGCHVRTVPAAECESLHLLVTVCRWRDVEFQVRDERDGEVLLEYEGGSAPEARSLGLERIERGVYRRWVPRKDAGPVSERAVSLDLSWFQR
jgi:hypothetical protein